MGYVYAMHGISPSVSCKRFTDRNYIGRELYHQHLQSKKEKYVPINQAVLHYGDALTIDDATAGAADAAILAREEGHEVTIFVNAKNIEDKEIYTFHKLNCFFDATDKKEIFFRGAHWSLKDHAAKKKLRAKVKCELMRSRTPGEEADLLEEVARLFDVNDIEIPIHLSTLTQEHLQMLVHQGVRIENHGWSHRNSSSVTWEETLSDIEKGKNWIFENCGLESEFFAVPFGTTLPKPQKPPQHYRLWFTLDDVLFNGLIGPSVYNRVELDLVAPR